MRAGVIADHLPDGKKQKARLEDGYQEAGYRSGWQVLSNSAAAVAAAFLWNAIFVPSSIQARLSRNLGLNVPELLNLGRVPTYDRGPTGWCPTDVAVSDGLSRLLVFAALGWVAFNLTARLSPDALFSIDSFPAVWAIHWRRS